MIMFATPHSVPEPSGPDDGVSEWSVAAALVGFAAALFGVYWDDAWHTDRGRDDLLSAPHLALYVGVAVAVGVVAWWGWTRRRVGWRGVAAGPIGVAIVGAAVTLGSAPVDEWWHTTFGRDAVLWSPPHLVALVGTVALGSGVALVAGRSTVAWHPRRPTRSGARRSLPSVWPSRLRSSIRPTRGSQR